MAYNEANKIRFVECPIYHKLPLILKCELTGSERTGLLLEGQVGSGGEFKYIREM